MSERFQEPGARERRPLLDFPGLSDTVGSPRSIQCESLMGPQISTTKTWQLLDYFRPVYPRIRWNDILMRIAQPGQPRNRNRLNQISSRGRKLWNMLAWHQNSANPKSPRLKNKVTDCFDGGSESCEYNTRDNAWLD